MNTVIQWNLQSCYAHFTDLKILIENKLPACICLQETLLNNSRAYPPGGCNIVTSTPTRDDGHERGTAILIHNRVFYQILQLDTNLQAVAV